MLVMNVTTKHTFTLTIAAVVPDRLQHLTPKNIFSFKIPSVSPHTRTQTLTQVSRKNAVVLKITPWAYQCTQHIPDSKFVLC